jgi:hypothetical protein
MLTAAAAIAAFALASPAFAQASPEQWLGQAQQDIRNNNAADATAAVNNAENQLLVGDPQARRDRSTRDYTLDNQALREMGRAREDLQYGNLNDASVQIGEAMNRPITSLAQ